MICLLNPFSHLVAYLLQIWCHYPQGGRFSPDPSTSGHRIPWSCLLHVFTQGQRSLSFKRQKLTNPLCRRSGKMKLIFLLAVPIFTASPHHSSSRDPLWWALRQSQCIPIQVQLAVPRDKSPALLCIQDVVQHLGKLYAMAPVLSTNFLMYVKYSGWLVRHEIPLMNPSWYRLC